MNCIIVLCSLVLVAGVCKCQVTIQCSATCGDSGCDDKTGNCYACKAGRYGPKCEQDCGVCVKEICSSRACTLGCKAGYFQVFTEPEFSNCQPCIQNCSICTNSTYCKMCKEGFYPNTPINSNGNGGTQCIPCSTFIPLCTSCYKKQNEMVCINCTEGYLISSNECVVNNCRNYGCLNGCDSTGNCYGCVDGFIGLKCSYRCNSSCASCTAYNQDICEKCHDGFYSNTCFQPCNLNCLSINNYTCNFGTGKCSNGCNNGFWGDWCENKCSVNCKEFAGGLSVCLQNGTCALGCKEGLDGDYCAQTTSVTTIVSSSVIGENTTQSSAISTTASNVTRSSESSMTTNVTASTVTQGSDKTQTQLSVSLNTHSSAITWTTTDTVNTVKKITETVTTMNVMTRTVAQNRDPSPNTSQTDINYTKDGDITSVTTPLPVFGKTAMVVNSEDTFPVGAISGGAGGGVVVIIVIVLVICFVKRRQRKGHDTQKTNNVGDSNILNPAFDPETPSANSDQPVTSQSTDYIYAKLIKPKDANSDMPAASPHTDYINAQPLKSKKSMINKQSIKDSQTKADMDINVLNDTEIKYTLELEDLDEDETAVKDHEIVTSTSDTYYNTEGILRSRIQVSKLLDYVKKKSDFQAEFERLPKALTRPCTEALKKHNLAKNRYNGIFAYDATRVVLKSNSYINASYIEGYKRPKAYIASLGPTKDTMAQFVTFWEMVWQEDARIIVMLTNLVESRKMKCEQYWPDVGSSRQYDTVTVTATSESINAEFAVRELLVSKGRDTRTVAQYHYTAWPDQSVPHTVVSLIEFREKVEKSKTTNVGPIIVHCSAGIGRTGTYIALDVLINEGKAENSVDLFGCVTALRGQRVNLVQNLEQYIFLHHSLVYALTCQPKPLTVSSLIHFLSDDNMHKQFQALSNLTALQNKESQTVTTNARKQDISGDQFRVKLACSKTDSMNAVYVDGYLQPNRYIIAQTPMPSNFDDFASLLYQENVGMVVSLDEEAQRDKPSDNKIVHYHFNAWKKEDIVPGSMQAFMSLLLAVNRQRRTDDRPILIHCLDGAKKSGLVCAIAIMLEKLTTDRELSVINTICHVRGRRRSALQDFEQFKFCYRCVNEYAKTSESKDYTNIL